MATSAADQVLWPALNVTSDGTPAAYVSGDIVPPPLTDAEETIRYALRTGGACRPVTWVTTSGEFHAEADTAAAANATREGGTLPVLLTPGQLPVVGSLPV